MSVPVEKNCHSKVGNRQGTDMNRAIWIAKKNELCGLIKQVSDAHGGDDVVWLREYAKEVIDAHSDDLNPALDCFRDLVAQLAYIGSRIVRHGT